MSRYRKLKTANRKQMKELLVEQLAVGLTRVPRRRRPRFYPKGAVLHITSRCHLRADLLAKAEVKAIVQRECLHYARVCNIAVLHWCVMDNHIHIIIRVSQRTAHVLVAKMIGTLKAQITRKYKGWYNHVYRRRKNWRPLKLRKGTLWDDRFSVTVATDSAGLVRLTAYVELNQIRRKCSSANTRLLAIRLLAEAAVCEAHSLRWYLGVTKDPGPLTDGADAVWARPEEVRMFGMGPLPAGWRRVRFDGHLRLMKPTPPELRRLPSSPVVDAMTRLLGERGFAEFMVTAIEHAKEKK